MIRVLLVDDHPIIRQGLNEVLTGLPDIKVLGEAGSAADALQMLQNSCADVVLLDISMPGRSGLTLIKEIIAECPSCGIIMLSMHPEDQFAMRSYKLGAKGYLTKMSSSDELLEAIREVAAGNNYITPEVASKMLTHFNDDGKKPHQLLSTRELEVLCLFASGNGMKEIANTLHLSEKTINTYRSRLLQKLNLKSSSELIQYAVKENLIQ